MKVISCCKCVLILHKISSMAWSKAKLKPQKSFSLVHCNIPCPASFSHSRMAQGSPAPAPSCRSLTAFGTSVSPVARAESAALKIGRSSEEKSKTLDSSQNNKQWKMSLALINLNQLSKCSSGASYVAELTLFIPDPASVKHRHCHG